LVFPLVCARLTVIPISLSPADTFQAIHLLLRFPGVRASGFPSWWPPFGAIGLFIFYHPPTFEEVHKRDDRSKWQEFKDLHFLGVLLFTGGITVLLLGISWGGISYPWKSAGLPCQSLLGS
jgi:hypothetical protein